MHAVVLAGGYATRLWPITKDRPKMFLPVGENAVIDHVFDELEADDRIEEVYVSTNERFAEPFREHIAESPFEKPTLSIEETTEEDEKFGVIGALAQLVEREGITEDTLVIAGDNLISFDVSEFVDLFEQKGSPVLAAYDVGSRQRASAYGLVELDGDRVVGFQEKPEDPRSTLVSIACYGFPGETLSRLDEYLEAGNNPDEPGWFIQWLVDREPVHAFTFDKAWFDIGTPESYLDAVAWYLDGESQVHRDATVVDSTIGENVHVMAGSRLESTTVENAVIFPDATVRNCELKETIIDTDTHIKEIALAGAVIGSHTKINGDDGER